MSKKEIESNFSCIDKDIDVLKKRVFADIENLENQLNIKPIQKIEPLIISSCSVREYEPSGWYSSKSIQLSVSKDAVKTLNGLGIGITGDASYGYYTFQYNSDSSKEKFLLILDKIMEMDEQTHISNVAASQQNTKTKESIMKTLYDVGIPKQKYEYATSRRTKKEWINQSWTYEIPSAFSTYSVNRDELKTNLIKRFDELYKKDQDKRKAEETAKQKEVQRKEDERELAFLLAKYGLDIQCDWQDLLNKIINQNNYLGLAYWLEKNRGDWNEGYSYAENGLAGFEIIEAIDQEIYDEISKITQYEDVDGRYFRDCIWSYGVLFGLAKEQNAELFADYEKVKAHCSDW